MSPHHESSCVCHPLPLFRTCSRTRALPNSRPPSARQGAIKDGDIVHRDMMVHDSGDNKHLKVLRPGSRCRVLYGGARQLAVIAHVPKGSSEVTVKLDSGGEVTVPLAHLDVAVSRGNSPLKPGQPAQTGGGGGAPVADGSAQPATGSPAVLSGGGGGVGPSLSPPGSAGFGGGYDEAADDAATEEAAGLRRKLERLRLLKQQLGGATDPESGPRAAEPPAARSFTPAPAEGTAWGVGDMCWAPFSDDGQFYEAQLRSLESTEPGCDCTVEFTEYPGELYGAKLADVCTAEDWGDSVAA